MGLLAVLLGALPAWGRDVPTVGELRVLVILARFPDRPLTLPRAQITGGPNALLDRLAAFWSEVSAGRLHVIPLLGGPTVTLPRPRAAYVQQPMALARDGIEAFAGAASDPADTAALAQADAVIVLFAGTGRESHVEGPDAGDPWSNYLSLTPPARGFDRAIVLAAEEMPPFSNFGVLCHEFGHLLGLPELYAPGAARHEGIGTWGLMGQGTWLGRGETPPALCAWSKMRLGWVDVDVVRETTVQLRLPAVEVTPRIVKIPIRPQGGPQRPDEYYLLENRQPIGADRALKGGGILVWHVDESVQGFRSAQANPAHKLLHLVEADGRGDLDLGHAAGGNRGEASDAWAGPPRWRRRLGAAVAVLGAFFLATALYRTSRPRPLLGALGRLLLAGLALSLGAWLRHGPVCGPQTPGMAPYDGSVGRVTLRNFSPSGPEMTVDVLIAPEDAPSPDAAGARRPE